MNSTAEDAIRSKLGTLVNNLTDVRLEIDNLEGRVVRMKEIELHLVGQVNDLTEALPGSVLS